VPETTLSEAVANSGAGCWKAIAQGLVLVAGVVLTIDT